MIGEGQREAASDALRVLATPLQMAVVGSTIADGGRRPSLTLLHGGRPHYVTVTNPRTAALVYFQFSRPAFRLASKPRSLRVYRHRARRQMFDTTI